MARGGHGSKCQPKVVQRIVLFVLLKGAFRGAARSLAPKYLNPAADGARTETASRGWNGSPGSPQISRGVIFLIDVEHVTAPPADGVKLSPDCLRRQVITGRRHGWKGRPRVASGMEGL